MEKQAKLSMSEGSIYKSILLFAAPIFLGNLFQQFYNIADSLIVGNFIGSQALAAVGSSGSLIFLLVGFFQGIAMGGGVVISRYIGAKDEENIEKSVHVTVAFGLITSVVLTMLGVFFAPIILRLMNTPESVLPDSITYFQVYFAGSLGLVMYNVFVAILQAAGDSKSPLIFLMISATINVVLDLVFIVGLGYGVGAAALATGIAQFVSAILCMIKLLRVKEAYRLNLRRIRIDVDMMKKIVGIGLPAGFQNSIISISNIVVQSNINSFGEYAMAGCGAFAKIEGFVFLPVTSFAMALTTFVSQNIGANKLDRVKKGSKFGLLCSIASTQLIGAIIYLFAPDLVGIFDSNPEVIAYGVGRGQVAAFFFWLMAYSHCVSAVLRGAGKTKVSFCIMLMCWCVMRVSIVTFLKPVFPTIDLVYWIYPVTWSFSAITFFIYYMKGKWLTNSI